VKGEARAAEGNEAVGAVWKPSARRVSVRIVPLRPFVEPFTQARSDEGENAVEMTADRTRPLSN
jgi:hypothetical protein